MAKPDMPFVTLLTDDEITKAICDYTVAKSMGVDPAMHDVDYRVSYRSVKDGQGTRLFATIAITSLEPKAEPKVPQ